MTSQVEPRVSICGFCVSPTSSCGLSPSRGGTGVSRIVSGLALAFRTREQGKQSGHFGSQTEEEEEDGYQFSDDEDEGECGVRTGRQVPLPRNPDHYRAMVYARAIYNAKLWGAQA